MINTHLGLVAPTLDSHVQSFSSPCRLSQPTGIPRKNNKPSVYERYTHHHQLSRAVCDSLQDSTWHLTLMVPDGHLQVSPTPIAIIMMTSAQDRGRKGERFLVRQILCLWPIYPWVHLQTQRVTSAVRVETAPT